MAKITIIGAGNVGATAAHLLALKNLADIVLVDVVEGLPQGKALDILESGPIEGFDHKIIGTNNYEDTNDSDIIVITAGIARKPGMTREDLLKTNASIVKGVVESAVKYSPNAILIVVTNPLDAMVYLAAKVSNFSKNKVIGMAGVLDTTRFKTFIAEELNINAKKIEAVVLGSHGDDMVPLISKTTVDGKPITDLLPAEKINKLVERTRNGGIEIINLLKTGSAYYAPVSSIVEMIDAILNDKKKLLPCAAYCGKEYGVGGYFIGVPAVLGRNGVEKIVEFDLDENEKMQFEKTVEHVKELCAEVDKLLTT